MSKPMHNLMQSRGNRTGETGRNALDESVDLKTLEITRSLQTTLDPERLIEIFSLEAGTLIVHQGLRYRNEDLDLDVRIGRQARHSCSYNLNIGDEPLGKLSFRRERKFTGRELETLENLLCSLLYPLRNALLYQDALQLAQKDPLTGTHNRAALDDTLRSEISHALRQDADYSLLILDIDHFKTINDRYGHITGDCALKALTAMVKRCKRDGDLLFRYGGEEFVVLMRDTDLEGATLLAERIRACIAREGFNCSGTDLSIEVSIGVSTLMEGDTPVSLFSRADQALYQAKKNGRNRVCVASTD